VFGWDGCAFGSIVDAGEPYRMEISGKRIDLMARLEMPGQAGMKEAAN
jgi:hypothetical protein